MLLHFKIQTAREYTLNSCISEAAVIIDLFCIIKFSYSHLPTRDGEIERPGRKHFMCEMSYACFSLMYVVIVIAGSHAGKSIQ